MRRYAKRQIAKSTQDPALLADIRRLITEARRHVAGAANATLTMLYWQVGQRIRTAILHRKHAAYGEQIVVSLIRQLSWTHFLALLPLKDVWMRTPRFE